ncbi:MULTISPECIES: GNAT family N-acetyltransferase [unclassified Sphingomonas]|uniref:GNAT family N-acetyltransferase n=1 Tax=unclassified Sphingomonas TaxID=196159 RepID=UPI00092631EC|nr:MULTISPECIES: GNAT family N-acetyltransferase [unclassified Sphingomonas]MBN8849205.1 GNAT family N-acetyltransferase [Sphingomonas sp.]OJV29421.1 MAG: GNAT family N-acetyltransferase [Sphingomonas sp. 67-36]
MGLTPVPGDHLATIVTSLEMTRRPPLRPAPDTPLRLVHWPAPDLDKYRALFRRVGGPWLWYSRLAMDDARLAEIVHAAGVSVFAAVDRAGIEVGMLELDHAHPATCELSYFGLVPELAGKGHGRWLMSEALTRAWRADVRRVTVNTCTLDHPSALNFYRAQGFVAVKRTIETFPDPRLLGLLPADAAPQIPLLASRR